MKTSYKTRTTHGHSRTPEYNVWQLMMQRCFNPKNKRYIRYGARGITVCESWQYFPNFIADMGKRPSDGHSIERKNNNGNYEPGNCYWATRTEQDNNTSKSRFLDHDGKRLTVKQWSDLLGIGEKTIQSRVDHYGWSVSDALTRPVNQNMWKNRSRVKVSV